MSNTDIAGLINRLKRRSWGRDSLEQEAVTLIQQQARDIATLKINNGHQDCNAVLDASEEWGEAQDKIATLENRCEEYDKLILDVHGALGGCFTTKGLQKHIRKERQRIGGE